MSLEIEKENVRLRKKNETLKKEVSELKWTNERTNEGLKELYRELEIRNEQLKKFDALKSQFVANVSHEYKSPLTIIRESMTMVADGILGVVNEKQISVLQIGIKTVDRINTLVMDMLDLSKIESGKMELKQEQFDINRLVRELVEAYQINAAKKKMSIESNVLKAPQPFKLFNIPMMPKKEESSSLVWGDRSKISQVMSNLISNAVKYTQDGGTVRIILGGDDSEVRFEVQDNGPGISEENLGKIFDKYERIMAEKQEGTGLGLVIAKDIIGLHKGKLWVESEAGEGSKFIFTLPRDSSKAK